MSEGAQASKAATIFCLLVVLAAVFRVGNKERENLLRSRLSACCFGCGSSSLVLLAMNVRSGDPCVADELAQKLICGLPQKLIPLTAMAVFWYHSVCTRDARIFKQESDFASDH